MDNHNEKINDNKKSDTQTEEIVVNTSMEDNDPWTYHEEDDNQPSKAISIMKRIVVVGGAVCFIVLAIYGVNAYIEWRFPSPTVASVKETVEEVTTEEDLNVKIEGENVDRAMEVSDLLNGEPEMAGGEEINKSLTDNEMIQSGENVVNNENQEASGNTSASIEGIQSISQEQIDAEIKHRQEVPVETMDKSILESLKSDDEAAMESIFNDEAYAKDIREHNNN